MRVLRNEILSPRRRVCEIAAAAAGNDDFATDLRVMFQNRDAAPQLPRRDRAKKPGGSATNDDRVVGHLSKVPLAQNADMVPYVPGHYVCQGTNRNRQTTCGAHPAGTFV